MLKVLKFGGSSLSSSKQFAKVREIVRDDESRKVVVVSAPGRRNPEDSKITDLLYLCHAHIKYDVAFDNIVDLIKSRYAEIRDECSLSCDIEAEIDSIMKGLDKKSSEDYIASRGEYLNALLMAEYLDYKFVDASEWLTFDYSGKVDYDLTESKLRDLQSVYEKIVTPGFYGAYENEEIKVLSRGGSDVTGSIAAASLDADMYENWTDVSGILMVDPRIVSNPKTIPRVTYDELRELSYMGAAVLHEDTVFPVRKKDIPVNIRNTDKPEDEGTIIRESFEDELEEEHDRFITGIAGKKDFSLINIYKNRMGEAKNILLRQVLELFDEYNIPIEQIPSGVDAFSVLFPSEYIKKRKYDLMADLRKIEGIDSCDLADGISLISIVGRQMAYRVGISGKIFKAIGDNNISIRTIEQGAEEINIMVGVATNDFEKTIRVLYDSFTL